MKMPMPSIEPATNEAACHPPARDGGSPVRTAATSVTSGSRRLASCQREREHRRVTDPATRDLGLDHLLPFDPQVLHAMRLSLCHSSPGRYQTARLWPLLARLLR